jgi:hypothetical protein
LLPANDAAKAQRREADGMADVYQQFTKKMEGWSKSGIKLA